MLFVYASTVNKDNNSYDIQIYDHAEELFPVADRIYSEDAQEIINFLKDYHDSCHNKYELHVNFTVKIDDPKTSDRARIKAIVKSLPDLYPDLSVTENSKSPSLPRMRKKFIG